MTLNCLLFSYESSMINVEQGSKFASDHNTVTFSTQNFPSKGFPFKFSSKSGEVLNLQPICLKIDFRHKILKCQCKTLTSTSKLTGVEISK